MPRSVFAIDLMMATPAGLTQSSRNNKIGWKPPLSARNTGQGVAGDFGNGVSPPRQLNARRSGANPLEAAGLKLRPAVMPRPIHIGGMTRWVRDEIDGVIDRAKTVRDQGEAA